MHASTSPSSPALSPDVLIDRRRPGRASADAALVPLLRQPAGPDAFSRKPLLDEAEQAEIAAEYDDDGRLVRGIGFGLLLSAPFWLFLAAIGRALLH